MQAYPNNMTFLIQAFPLRTAMCCLDESDDGVFHLAWWQYVAWREYVGWYLRIWSPAEWEDLASTLMYAHADRPFIRTTKNVEWPYDEHQPFEYPSLCSFSVISQSKHIISEM